MNVQTIVSALKNSLLAIVKGEFILRLNVGRYLGQIVYTFILMAITIWISLAIDNTLIKVEKNRSRIHELEIAYSERCYEQAALERRSTVASKLVEMGSKVAEPEKPATVIE